MTTPDFNITFSVDQSPSTVFNAITNVRGWWSENVEGGTARLNDEFTYQVRDIHKCTMKLIEVIPSKKVVWLVLDNYFNFTEDRTEWTGTTIEFEITGMENKTQLHFTHRGLVPTYECYDICFEGWTRYIGNSLRNLITKGKGQPNPKENVIA
jgi:hypothetical protein